MQYQSVKIVLYVLGFLLAIGVTLWIIYLSLQTQLAENSYIVGFLGITAIIFLLIARRISEKHG